MSAVMEAPLEVKPWEMPKVHSGQVVVFWRNGTRTGVREVATVVRTSVSGKSVRLSFTDEPGRDGVRHVDDPRLKTNEHMREDGAWEHTDETKALTLVLDEFPALRERVEVLEQLLEKSTSKTK